MSGVNGFHPGTRVTWCQKYLHMAHYMPDAVISNRGELESGVKLEGGPFVVVKQEPLGNGLPGLRLEGVPRPMAASMFVLAE